MRINTHILVLAVLGQATLCAREWKDTAGRAVAGDILGVESGNVVIQLPNKQRAALPLANLSETDLSWVRTWLKGKPRTQWLPAPVWPESVQQPEIHVQALAHDKRGYGFTSPHYDFNCDAEISASVMNDFATVAEGTVRLMQALPIHFPRAESRTFYARIYQNREGYERSGGPPGSGGVYMTADLSGQGVLLVPFESLGIEQFGGRNTKSLSYKATVLIHEMVHQSTAELLQLMPKWVAEGMAEYGANMTYRNGAFSLGERDRLQALRQRLEYYENINREVAAKAFAAPARTAAGRTNNTPVKLPAFWVMRPSELVTKDEIAWSTEGSGRASQIQLHRMYLSSLFLMYYFMHIADHAETRRLRVYFDDIAEMSLYLRTKGAQGNVPDELKTRSKISLKVIQDHFTGQLVGPDGLAALDADFHAKFTAMGFRIGE